MFSLSEHTNQNQQTFRATNATARLNEYILPEPDMQSQIHKNSYQFINVNPAGTLCVPAYNGLNILETH